MKLLIVSEHSIIYKFMLLFNCWSLLLLSYIFVNLLVKLKEVPELSICGDHWA